MNDSGPSSQVPPADVVVLVVAIVAVSTSAPLIRGAEAPTLAIAMWRNALALPVLLVAFVIVGRRHDSLRRLRGPVGRTTVLAGVFLGAHFATWIPSLSFTTIASSVALVATQPVWAAIIARWQGDPIERGTWLGIGVALVGVVVLTGVDVSISTRALFGDLLALVGGMLAAAYVTAGARARTELSTLTYSLGCYSVAGVALLAVCVVGRQPVVGYPGSTWLAIAALTIGPQLLGHTLLNRVLRSISPTVVSMCILFEIVGAALLAFVFFDETPPAGAIPAALLIAAGVVIVVRSGAAGRAIDALPVE